MRSVCPWIADGDVVILPVARASPATPAPTVVDGRPRAWPAPRRREGYDPGMRYLPTLLLVLSLPAGMLGYAVGSAAMTALMPGQAQSVLMLFVPLLVAGLFMLPFLVPFFDRKAKQDLAAYRAREGLPSDGDDKPERQA
jgi:hypothetical protein